MDFLKVQLLEELKRATMEQLLMVMDAVQRVSLNKGLAAQELQARHLFVILLLAPLRSFV